MSDSKSTEELQQEIRAIIKAPMKSTISTADIAVSMMSSTALSEKVFQLSQLVEEAKIKAELDTYKYASVPGDFYWNKDGRALKVYERIAELKRQSLNKHSKEGEKGVS